MKKIFLTGGEGFIGRNFIRLYGDKYNIVSYTKDIRQLRFWEIVEGNYDMVVHLAALAGVRRSREMPNEYWDVNVNGTHNIFKACQLNKITPVIYASSSSVYEWWLSPYAATKYVNEVMAPANSLGLRFHTVYGNDSRPDMLYDRLIKRDPTLTYLTNHTRDYTHVEDVASAIDICIEQFMNLTYYNKRLFWVDVGNGRPVSVKDVADKIWPDHNLPFKEVTGEREHTCANPTDLFEAGWEPKNFILD